MADLKSESRLTFPRACNIYCSALILLLLCSLNIHAQNIQFERFYGDQLEFKSIESLDSCYILGAKSFDTSAIEIAWAYLLDRRGDEIWSSSFRIKGSARFNQIIAAKSGGFWALGSTNNLMLDEQEALLIRLDDNGDSLYSRRFPFNGGAEFFAAIENDSAEIILTGRSQGVSGLMDALLCKVDSLGNMIWFRNYGSFSQEQIFDLYQSDSNRYVLAGSFFDGSRDKTYSVKADFDGEAIWTRSYGPSDTDFGQSIIKYGSSYWIAGASVWGDSLLGALFKIDEDGLIEQYLNWGEFDNNIFRDIIPHEDGMLISGQTGKTSGEVRAMCQLRDSLGNLIWVKEYGNAEFNNFWAATTAIDSGLAFVGSSGDKGYFVLTLEDGSLCQTPQDLVAAPDIDQAILSWDKNEQLDFAEIQFRELAESSFRLENALDTPYVLSDLNPNTTYIWQVSAVCSELNQTTFSELDTFNTLMTSSHNAISENHVLVFPNPFKNYLRVQFENSFQDYTTWTLTDIHGSLQMQGSFRGSLLNINPTDLAAGIYFLQVPEINFKARLLKQD